MSLVVRLAASLEARLPEGHPVRELAATLSLAALCGLVIVLCP